MIGGNGTALALGLRAADALHLAICADHGATLCTLRPSSE